SATTTHTQAPTDTNTPSPTPTNTPTQTPTATITPTPEGLAAFVTAENLNVRNGPGEDFDIIAHVEQGITLPVIGRDEDGFWLLVEYDNNQQGWIFSGFASLNTDIQDAPDVQPTPLPDYTRLEGVTHLWQAFNNCAPTALTIALSYYIDNSGSNRVTPVIESRLDHATNYLRPNRSGDVSVDIAEMVQYVNDEFQGVRSVWRMGGNWTTIRRLVAAGFPVIIETGIQVNNPPPGQPGGWAGHNRVVIGYDGDDILTYDSYLGHGNFEGYRVNQDVLDAAWRELNRHYMVLYDIDREDEVRYIMGADWIIANSIEHAHRVALAEIAANEDGGDAEFFSLYNIGNTFTYLGDYDQALEYYEAALELSEPFRIFWYQFGIFEAYYNTGQYGQVRWFANNALQGMGGNAAEELYYWRGMSYAAQGNFDNARDDLERALEFNPRYDAASEALQQIESGTYQPPS
ncbi:MAG: tetratricopeptide repeat protein, partial [Anaerolineales bacterium]